MKPFLGILVLSVANWCQAQVIVPTNAECATSIDGTVVMVPNPLQPPQLAVVYSGSLPAGNYYVEEAWYDSAGHTTLVGPEELIQLTGSGEIQENPPASGMAATAVGRNIYIGTTSGSETYQGTVVGATTYTQSTALATGAAVPAANNTICQVIANDAIWPTGTGYAVSITAPNGNTQPGYPSQWQLLGPGNTINLSQGLPQYNGVVQFPVPILSVPYGHGPQSISGNLSLGGYTMNAGAYQIGGTYGQSGQLFVSTGTGTAFTNANVLGQSLIASVVAGTAAGTTGVAYCQYTCTDSSGQITVSATSGQTSYTLFTVTFGATHNSASCTFSPIGSATTALSAQIGLVDVAPASFALANYGSTVSPGLYFWSYTCTFH